jgi:hypothetical protein
LICTDDRTGQGWIVLDWIAAARAVTAHGDVSYAQTLPGQIRRVAGVLLIVLVQFLLVA